MTKEVHQENSFFRGKTFASLKFASLVENARTSKKKKLHSSKALFTQNYKEKTWTCPTFPVSRLAHFTLMEVQIFV